jgi:3,4-dihydroxy 2-butanone 4-phosphate synthase/GTP cyclohydrolase II
MQMTHQLRARHDGILVGIGTVLADNPRLTTRLAGGTHPQPVVLDSQLRTPLEANLLQHPHPVILAHAEGMQPDRKSALQQAGAQLVPIPQVEGGTLDLEALLQALKAHGIGSLMVEGGAKVITSFLRQALVDMLVLTISPRLVGGLHAPGKLLETQPEIQTPRWVQLGQDLIIWGRLE